MFPPPDRVCEKCGKKKSPYGGTDCNNCSAFCCSSCVLAREIVSQKGKCCPKCGSKDVVDLGNVVF